MSFQIHSISSEAASTPSARKHQATSSSHQHQNQHHHRHHNAHASTSNLEYAKSNIVTEFEDHNLHSACENGNLELVKYAVKQGQPINSVLNGVLPIHAAASSGNEQIVRFLIEHGADVNAITLPRKYSSERTRAPGTTSVSTPGSTPLHFAAANGHTQIIELLLLYGANASIAEKFGLTPEIVARRKNYIEAANLLQAIEKSQHDDEDDSISLTPSHSSHSKRKRLHPKRSIDAIAQKISHASSSSSHLPLPLTHTNSSSSINLNGPPASPSAFNRRGSVSSHLSNDASHRRPSLPSVFEKASHPGAALKAAITNSALRRGSDAALERSNSGKSFASSVWSRGGPGDRSPTLTSTSELEEGGESRRKSVEFAPVERIAEHERESSVEGLEKSPLSAPPTKANFSSNETRPRRSSSVSSLVNSLAGTSIGHRFSRPRQPSQLSWRSVKSQPSPLAGPPSPSVFIDDDDDEVDDNEGENGTRKNGSQDDGEEDTEISDSRALHQRDTSLTLSTLSADSPRPTSTLSKASDYAETAGARLNGATPVGAGSAYLAARGLQGRNRGDSVGSSSSSISIPRRGAPQPLTKAYGANNSQLVSNELVPGRIETRSSRSNSVGTDGVFSSSPASSYSGPGTFSTYAPSNSTNASSVATSSLSPNQPGARHRQPLLSPLYEATTTSKPLLEQGRPITTSAQARKRVKRLEHELLNNYDPSVSSSGSSRSRPSLSLALAEYGQSLTLARNLTASEGGSVPDANGYRWETINKTGAAKPVAIPNGKAKAPTSSGATSKGPSGSSTPSTTLSPKTAEEGSKVPHWRAVPGQDTLLPPPSIPARRSASPSSMHSATNSTKRRDSAVPITRASTPSSSHSVPAILSTAPNGISYVEVIPPTPTSSSPSSHARPKPLKTALDGLSDRTHSQKGGTSVTSAKDQIQAEAAEQARIAAVVPQAVITAPKKKGFAKRIFGGKG